MEHPENGRAHWKVMHVLGNDSDFILTSSVFCILGNAQSVQTEAGGADEPAGDMQQCH